MTNRYSNSKVYKMYDDEGYFYIGSTCLQLHQRFYHHKVDSLRRPTAKIYQPFTREKFINKFIKIILIESFVLNSNEELIREKDKFIQQHIHDDKCLNTHYAILNQENRKLKQDKYSKENAEKIQEMKRNY